MALADTTASAHYIDVASKGACIGIKNTDDGPTVSVTNGKTIRLFQKATRFLSKNYGQKPNNVTFSRTFIQAHLFQ